MKATLKVEGHEVSFDMPQEMQDKLTALFPDLKKHTGYERAERGADYYFSDVLGRLDLYKENKDRGDDNLFLNANYYTDANLTRNNIRADALMRKLRRFSAEHRCKELNWTNREIEKFYIAYDFDDKTLLALESNFIKVPAVYFDTKEHCRQAIVEFKDELIWYFTEYKDTTEVFV